MTYIECTRLPYVIRWVLPAIVVVTLTSPNPVLHSFEQG
jgi:hypothetical protein